MAETAGKLADNILTFARLLRAAGLPIGTGSVLQADAAVNLIGVRSRVELKTCLRAVLITRREHCALFDQAFDLFWQNPQLMDRVLGAMLPTVRLPEHLPEQQEQNLSRRLSEASNRGINKPATENSQSLEFDASLTWSDQEVLQEKDFEQMSAEEIALARKAIGQLILPLQEIKTRRFMSGGPAATIDMRSTLRAALRQSDSIPLQFRQRRVRNPALVVLCDISGSMSQYSRMFLHFMHAVTNDRDRVHSFVFGTRLTNISRYLNHKDVDLALEKTTRGVQDWSGGTRIGTCLAQFNRQWSRRVLSQGAITLLITDGLDRDEGVGLRQEMDRLARSSRRLVWLNPLLRYQDFEPRALGIRAMLPCVDEFLPAHNINSLAELVRVLGTARMGLKKAA